MSYVKTGLAFIFVAIVVSVVTVFILDAIGLPPDTTAMAIFMFFVTASAATASSFVSKDKNENLIVTLSIVIIAQSVLAVMDSINIINAFTDPRLIAAILGAALASIYFAKNKRSLTPEKSMGTKAVDAASGEIDVTKKSVVVLDSQYRDDSTTSINSQVRNSTSYVGNDRVNIPYTMISTTTDEKKLQDIWYRDDSGAESMLRLTNVEISVREGHELSFFYTKGRYLDYVKNEMTGEIISTGNFLIAGDIIKPSSNVPTIMYLAFLGAVPYIGAIGVISSALTSYRFLNKPVKRPHLGKATIFSFLAAGFVAFLNSGPTVDNVMEGHLIDALVSAGSSVVIIAVLLSIGYAVTASKADTEKDRYYQYIINNY